MGDKQNQPFQPSFNVSLRIGFQGSGVTSDGVWSRCVSWMSDWASVISLPNT